MFASLSAESRAPQLLRELGISLAFVSALTGIEQTKLSLGFRQLKAFSNKDAWVLMNTLTRLIELRESVAPLTIDLKNASNARLVLDSFENMDTEMIREKVSALFQQ